MVDMDAFIDIGVKILLIMVLTFFSQTFTGLNIGLMSLDTAQLKILMEVPDKDEAAVKSARYARKILPLRQQGNLLLCTILLGNTAVNAVMAILMAGFAGGFVGFLVTTLLIVFMSEILPQSICTRHGLYLGALGSPIIHVAMCLFYPVTKPYAFVLDRVFPQRENMLDRSQLKALVEYQETAAPGMLAAGQAEMLIGALGFASQTVRDVMVPMERAFTIMWDTRLDYELIAALVQKGYSRFPLLDPQTLQVRGILHCKDFLTHGFTPLAPKGDAGQDSDAGARTSPGFKRMASFGDREPETAGELLMALRDAGQERPFCICGRGTTLQSLLTYFKSYSHLAVIADVDMRGLTPDTGVKHIGIVTLHNIFEAIVQSHGFDEQNENNQNQFQKQKLLGTVHLFDRRFRRGATKAVGNAEGQASSDFEPEPLGAPEAQAVMSFLTGTQPAFSHSNLTEEALMEMLLEIRPKRLPKGQVLYRRQERATSATVILQGAMRILSGQENIESTLGPWTCIGMHSLEPPVSLIHAVRQKGGEGEELLELHDTHDYIPDFEGATLTDGALVLQIERAAFLRCFHKSQVKMMQQQNPNLRAPRPSKRDL